MIRFAFDFKLFFKTGFVLNQVMYFLHVILILNYFASDFYIYENNNSSFRE